MSVFCPQTRTSVSHQDTSLLPEPLFCPLSSEGSPLQTPRGSYHVRNTIKTHQGLQGPPWAGSCPPFNPSFYSSLQCPLDSPIDVSLHFLQDLKLTSSLASLYLRFHLPGMPFLSSCHNCLAQYHLPTHHHVTGSSISLTAHYYSNYLVYTSVYLFIICQPLTRLKLYESRDLICLIHALEHCWAHSSCSVNICCSNE